MFACLLVCLAVTEMHAMTSVGRLQMRAAYVGPLNSFIDSLIKYAIRSNNRETSWGKLSSLPFLYQTDSWFVAVLLAKCLKLHASFIYLCLKMNVHFSFVKYDILKL